MSGPVVYTYAVARPFEPAVLAGRRGIDGGPVELVASDDAGLVALTTPVPADLGDRLDDLAALEPLARAHHEVVDTVARYTTVLPFRMGTLHDDEASVRTMLRDRRTAFDTALDRVAGCVEVGVKAYTVARAATAAEPVAVAAGSASPGRDYLASRRRQTDVQQDEQRRAVGAAGRIAVDLMALARDGRRHRLQDARLSGEAGENLLNASYLVDLYAVDRFVARIGELDAAVDEVRLRVTGPWAPYSFAESVDGEAP